MTRSLGLLLAAGPGRRYGADHPKQFEVLAGRPVLIHALGTLQAADVLDDVGIVVPPGEEEAVRTMIDDHDVQVPLFLVEGGKTRRDSVRRGLGRTPESVSRVAIHDAARPAVTVDLVDRVMAPLGDTDAAGVIPGVPVVDTIKEVSVGDETVVRRTPRRPELRRIQTPQAFRFEALREAHAAWDPDRRATDDAMMVERIDRRVLVVEGEASNVKLTHPEDRRVLEQTLGEPS